MTPKQTTIAICNLKGGTAKTTTSILLATALTRLGKTATVIDLDPQGSATEWATTATEDNAPLPFDVIPGNAQSIRRQATTTDFIVLDCPPLNPHIIDAAVAAADTIIVPVSPSGIEVDRMWDAIQLAGSTPVKVLLTQVIPHTKSMDSLIQALEEEKVPVFDTVIPRREKIRSYYCTTPDELFGYEKITATILQALGGNYGKS